MKKYKNNILFKNIIVLLVSGAIAKIIGMFGKIIYTRTAGVNVVSLYALITPTLMLIISLTQFSFPISISKLSAEEKYDNKSLLKSAYLVGFIINIILILILLLSSNLIASLLHNNALSAPIRSVAIILPFITVSSIMRGFLHGKEDMVASSKANILEEVIKIILIITLLPIALAKSSILAIIFIILFNVITESFSILLMGKVINKKYINKQGNIKKCIMKDIIKISIPTTSVRLISSVGFFLEPIILTFVLLKTGYNINYITLEYGIINSYIIPLLSVPTFFSISIAAALLPNITKAYKNKEYKIFNNKLLKLMIVSLIVGIISLTVMLLFPKTLLRLIYSVNYGINYLYLIGPFFLLIYMQPTLSVAMQAMNKTSKLFLVSVISITFKYTLLYILGLLNFGMNSLIFAMISGIVITTISLIFIVIKELGNKT